MSRGDRSGAPQAPGGSTQGTWWVDAVLGVDHASRMYGSQVIAPWSVTTTIKMRIQSGLRRIRSGSPEVGAIPSDRDHRRRAWSQSWCELFMPCVVRGRASIRTTIHKLWHYSATELITARVVWTVASRLGHGDGRIALRVYAGIRRRTNELLARCHLAAETSHIKYGNLDQRVITSALDSARAPFRVRSAIHSVARANLMRLLGSVQFC